MTKRRKAIVIALSVLVFLFVGLASVNSYISDSFILLVYEEGQPITDPSLGAPENARLTKTYSLKGINETHDEKWNLLSSEMYFWFPLTIKSIKDPETVTYRMLQTGTGISLPHGSRASEITVSGKDASAYMQVWLYEDIPSSKANPSFGDEGHYEFERACLEEHRDALVEIEVLYADGVTSSKRYSLLPGYGEEWGMASLAVAEVV